ncbi:hypothetical protein ACIQ7D_09550 [Streptomyces sp. NPDC096310]|uniref:hypothetical protein n=1 Tax=Streptomyces sp. NPDC096310 TaxID=3366082 RepID=UPI003818676F
MDNDVSAGSTNSTSILGHLALGLTLLAGARFADSSGLAEVGGWVAAVSGLASWYGATAALAHWPTTLPRRRAAGRGVAATG